MVVRIILVNGSPRKDGNTARLLQVAAEGAKEIGDIKIIHLIDYKIFPCVGCVSDEEKLCRYPCVIEDDMKEIYEQIIYSDGMIFASPIYWYSPSGIMKNFIDRLTALENMVIHEGRSRLEGKVCGVIAVGNDSGSIQLISTLLTTFVTMGFVIPPWSVAYYHAMGNVLDDEETCRDAYNVGRSVSLMAKTLKEVGDVRWYSNVRIKELISKTSIPPDVDYQQRADKLRQIWR